MKGSIILCTHNPRPDYFSRCLQSINSQNINKNEWELIVIDNLSDEPLKIPKNTNKWGSVKLLRETKIGLTNARLCGIFKSKGGILVFVDDDNVLSADYAKNAAEISERMPWLGAFNGSTTGEYEVELPGWASNMPIQLAVREVSHPAWGCLKGTLSLPFAPVGAGMVIRKKIAIYYAKKIQRDDLRKLIERRGQALASGGDSDMAYCACELGYAVGVFPELSLTHLISKHRINKEYFLKLAEGMGFSHSILCYIWDQRMPEKDEKACLSVRVFKFYQQIRRRIARNQQALWMEQWQEATDRGIRRARSVIEESLKTLPRKRHST